MIGPTRNNNPGVFAYAKVLVQWLGVNGAGLVQGSVEIQFHLCVATACFNVAMGAVGSPVGTHSRLKFLGGVTRVSKTFVFLGAIALTCLIGPFGIL